jgi:UDPglucose 6-dehydrogenase
MTTSLDAALVDADAILLLVKHAEFVNLQPGDMASKTSARVAIDCVNAWDAGQWQKAGFHLVRLGVRKQ